MFHIDGYDKNEAKNHSYEWKRESEGDRTRKEHTVERQRGAKRKKAPSGKAITERS